MVFSGYTPVSSTNKTDRHDITEILLKVALNTINESVSTYLIYLTNIGKSTSGLGGYRGHGRMVI
jgi:hypothetical protein